VTLCFKNADIDGGRCFGRNRCRRLLRDPKRATASAVTTERFLLSWRLRRPPLAPRRPISQPRSTAPTPPLPKSGNSSARCSSTTCHTSAIGRLVTCTVRSATGTANGGALVDDPSKMSVTWAVIGRSPCCCGVTLKRQCAGASGTTSCSLGPNVSTRHPLAMS
jgi:hypothetical protein